MRRHDRLRSIGLWLAPGMGVKRHVSWAVFGGVTALGGAGAFALWLLGDERRAVAAPVEAWLTSAAWTLMGGWAAGTVTVVGIAVSVAAVGRLNRSLLSNWMDRPRDAASVLHRRLTLARGPRIVALGGGTGLSRLLRGLRPYTSNLTAVVAVSDDGGSSGRLRSAFGMPAPGDLSDCLAALSVDEASLGRLLQYRFHRGDELAGHTFGNLLITTLSEVESDFGQALRAMQRLLDLDGAVWPATAAAVTLRVEKADGRVVEGESAVRQVPGAARSVQMRPADAEALPEVVTALAEADMVVLGPGSLFTSTIPPFLVPAVGEALRTTRAAVVQVTNIMTEAGETDGFDAWSHVEALQRHLGRWPDLVVVNTTRVGPGHAAAYRQEGATEVEVDAAPFTAARVALAAWPLVGEGSQAQHDADALAGRLVAWCVGRGGRQP